MKKDIIKALYMMSTALNNLDEKEKSVLTRTMVEIGFVTSDVDNVNKFILSNLTPSEYQKQKSNQAILSYIEGFKQVKRYMDMANGYQEMGEINKEIAEEDFHLEEEGERLVNEVVAEKGKGDTKEA
ncbi:hypothetical protein PQE75_gp119 [Bacillus phage vB_BcoS-136]|uniref:Uncharacterized protein n=1 Tax=Bacillus phage vB_BcoS-136 TaxID=2419619 RepID=A0A3G3BW27_9CAUD|nr:hypothetical protein PQE75_gp119 [Bacillus phage vB_BcoS-136]AYP68360.1 hypothetical protein vBBcoS136_00246 [Bacillus phage vB_BcoS-136]